MRGILCKNGGNIYEERQEILDEEENFWIRSLMVVDGLKNKNR